MTTDSKLRDVPQTEEEWREILGPEQYQVLRQAGTERPFTGEYNAVWDEGTYRCAGCGNQLFDRCAALAARATWATYFRMVRRNTTARDSA